MRSVAFSRAVDLNISPDDADLRGVCGILIPAYDEETTVSTVIAVALQTRLGPVLVVDDGSEDGTGAAALNAGATVLTLPENSGKGGAVFAGASALKTDVVVLIDADLVGLIPQHLHDLARPVLDGRLEMTRGVFVGGRWRTTAAQNLTPVLNGQRTLVREKLLSVPGLAQSGYGVEVAITEEAKRARWRTGDIPLHNLSQVMKEEKRGFRQGFRVRLGMYRDILRAYLKTRA